MSITSTDFTQLAFSMFENPGVYAVLLGSGGHGVRASLKALELVRQEGTAAGTGEQDDWHRKYAE